MSSDEAKALAGRRKSTKSSVLTEDQKKAHHIASEQKRRENIRSEFDKIVSLTPTLTESENRSELNILTKSADYIDQLKDENSNLVELCRMKGIKIPEELIYNGPTSDGADIAK
ncbi:basic helix-loop-helix transcription factor [Scheffersomyces xylosifermentans]|uniref:basic helix-loop-helix transcription factor n=1 Tax=Scheffersomyces xylosifermentans TaxID=1304137 RepID=UPI00315CB4B5